MTFVFTNMLFDIKRILKCSTSSIFRRFSSVVENVPSCPGPTKDPCISELCHIGDGKQPKVIIIGAGVAGLSAAERLVMCGIKNVTILEASSRVGGRIHTCDMNKCKIELGAQWIIGGTIRNPIYNLAMQEQLLDFPITEPDPYRGVYFTSNGLVINEYVYKRAIALFDFIKKNAANVSMKEKQQSLWEYLVNAINKGIKEMTENEKIFSSRILYGLTNDLKSRMGADLRDIPLERYVENQPMPGAVVPVLKGFENVLTPLINLLPKDAIKLGKKVTKIRWVTGGNPHGRVVLSTDDGCVCGADYVIFTPSLGVLKKYHEDIFCPRLPMEKIDAIEKIGFGYISKVFLQFEKPFWIKNEGYLRPCWSYKELDAKCGWITSIGLIEEVPGCDNILNITVGGPDALQLERDCDRDVIQNVMRIIHSHTNDTSLPFPNSMVKSGWGDSNNFLGAVSFLSKNSMVKHQVELGRDIPYISESSAPTLLFAGEATAPWNHATVHGARISGIREAEKILMITRRFKGPPPYEVSKYCT